MSTPAARSPGSARRRGVVLPVVVLLVVIVAITVSSRGLVSSQRHAESIRLLAGQCATRTAHAIVQRAFARLVEASSRPHDRAFIELRRRLVAARGASVDLSDLVAGVDTRPALTWRRSQGAPSTPVGTVRLEAVTCRAERVAAIDGSCDERRSVVRVEVALAVELAGQTARRSIAECRQLRLVVSGPPRPFDQVGLYVGHLSSVTDAVRANHLRSRILAVVDSTRERLAGLKRIRPELARAVEELEPGLPRTHDAKRGVPELPEVDSAIVGLAEVGATFRLEGLDLAAGLGADELAISSLTGPFERAARSGGEAALVPAATALLKALNEAVMRMWLYQRVFRIVPREGDEFAAGLGQHERALGAAHYRTRALARLEPGSVVLADWRAGRRALSGVFELASAEPVALAGPLAGRAVVVIDAPRTRLSSIPAGKGDGELLTVVCLKGSLEISGEVHASIVAAPGVQLDLREGTSITGSLLVPAPASRPRLSACSLTLAPGVGAGSDAASALAIPGRGAYAVGISPEPLWLEGGRS